MLITCQYYFPFVNPANVSNTEVQPHSGWLVSIDVVFYSAKDRYAIFLKIGLINTKQLLIVPLEMEPPHQCGRLCFV